MHFFATEPSSLADVSRFQLLLLRRIHDERLVAGDCLFAFHGGIA